MKTLSLVLAGLTCVACVVAGGCRSNDSGASVSSAVTSARLPEIRYYVIGDA